MVPTVFPLVAIALASASAAPTEGWQITVNVFEGINAHLPLGVRICPNAFPLKASAHCSA
jgi:hypothetical protein